MADEQKPVSGWRRTLYVVIFEHGTPAGKRFDLALLILILASVGAVVMESVAGVRLRYGRELLAIERGDAGGRRGGGLSGPSGGRSVAGPPGSGDDRAGVAGVG